mmetsp:Transcript_12632/g.36336  ORF Transcript_12632/g.36336 Transcript_12632/m.36336 type:complete len:234 (+) Transcript_12632:876-1577(+)
MDGVPLLHAVARVVVFQPRAGGSSLLGIRLGQRILELGQRVAVELRLPSLPRPWPAHHRKLLHRSRRAIPRALVLHPAETDGVRCGCRRRLDVLRGVFVVRLGSGHVRHHQQEDLLGHRPALDLHLRLRDRPAHRELPRQLRRLGGGRPHRRGLQVRPHCRERRRMRAGRGQEAWLGDVRRVHGGLDHLLRRLPLCALYVPEGQEVAAGAAQCFRAAEEGGGRGGQGGAGQNR